MSGMLPALLTPEQDAPCLFFVGGGDGVGKSTLIRQMAGKTEHAPLPLVDTESIFRESGAGWFAAARAAIGLAGNHIASRTSFVRETTLTSRYDFRLLDEAKRKGYRTYLIFLGIVSEDVAVKRVDMRARQGGTVIADGTVRRHFGRSLANLHRAIEQFDHVTLIDNSTPSPKLFARFEHGTPVLYTFCPVWFRHVQKEKGYRFTGVYD